jgi:hypothetical protein
MGPTLAFQPHSPRHIISPHPHCPRHEMAKVILDKKVHELLYSFQ